MQLNEIIRSERLRLNLERRFWPKVDRRGENDCWPWAALARHPFGYGRMSYGRGVNLKAHRVAYALEYGEIPKGKNVIHACDRPSCCNARHLSIASQRENVHDMIRKGRDSKPPRHLGDAHPKAAYTTEQSIKIASDTRPAVVVADQYGISAKTVYQIRRGTARISRIDPHANQ